ELFLPAKALDGRGFVDAFITGHVFSYADLFGYAAAVLLLEPFYVAAGFALYLNRRTLLEGWDIEVSLRRLAQRHAAAAMLIVCWALAVGAVAYAIWWAIRMLPRVRAPVAEAYRPPASLFGMELAPEKLPPDVGAAAAELVRAGRVREALALLYRGALSVLVHQ